MRPLLSKEEVAKAISTLSGQGKKTTLSAIHAALNFRGSMSTLVRIKAELDTEAHPIRDSEEGLQTFREVWALAVESGRKQGETMAAELREGIQALAVENERLEGMVAAASNAAKEFESAKERAEADLNRERLRLEGEANQAKTALGEAGLQAAAALQKLADAQVNHASQLAALQGDLAVMTRKAHDFELRLARALALLETKGFHAENPAD